MNNLVDRPEIRELLELQSPLEREMAARKVMEEARELLESASLVRAGAIKEMYDVLGATKTARLLGMNRVALYRVIEPVRTAEERDRRAMTWLTAAELILRGASAFADVNTESDSSTADSGSKISKESLPQAPNSLNAHQS